MTDELDDAYVEIGPARSMSITKQDAATLVEGLTMLAFFEAKKRKLKLPYDAKSIATLRQRVLNRWPELNSIYGKERR